MTKLSLIISFVVLLAGAAAQSVTCPIDDSGAYFTATLFSHTFWVRS